MSIGLALQDYLKTLKVLYVEDDPDVRDQLSQYLRRRVGQLLVAEDGAAGLEIFRKELPDVVISDILMPKMDGISMAREIRAVSGKTPIIVTTAFEQTDYLMRSIEVGVDKYITKPINTDVLYRSLQECARQLCLEEKLKLAGKVFETSLEAILITNVSNEIISVNPAFTTTTGYTEDEVLGRNPRLLASGKQDRQFYEAMWAHIHEHGIWQGEVWNRRKNGEIYPEWLSITILKDSQGRITHHVGIFTDISERKLAEERIRHLAQHDPLTGLPNRNLLSDRAAVSLATADRSGEKVALMLLDLDNFKPVNDTFGHLVGDRLLQEVAERLQVLFRASDTVCRLGGDEFVVLINGVADEDDARRAAEKVVGALGRNVTIDGRDMGVTVSLGIALYPDHASDLECLLHNADVAMYVAKRDGGDGFAIYQQQGGG